MLRALIRASTKGPSGGFGPHDPERDSPVYAAVLERVLDRAGIVRIPLFHGHPPDPSWVESEQSKWCHYRITGALLEISDIVNNFDIPEDVDLGDVRHLVMYGEMNFVDGLLERLPNLETIAALDAGFHQKDRFEYLHRLGQAHLPRLRTFVFDTIDLEPRYMNIDMVTCPRKVARSIDQVLQHQFNPFRTLATDQYGRAREDPGAHDGRLLVLVRHVVDHTEESFRDLHENAGIEHSDDDEYREEYVPFPGRITLLP